MNYGALKGLVESVLKNYKCPECNSIVTENSVDVIGAAGNTINIDVECSKCHKHSMIKSEIVTFDLSKMNINPEVINNLKLNIKNIKLNVTGKNILNQDKGVTNNKTELKTINDENIVDLNKNLRKRNVSAFDLFGDEN